jgi:hypothetical protein
MILRGKEITVTVFRKKLEFKILTFVFKASDSGES